MKGLAMRRTKKIILNIVGLIIVVLAILFDISCTTETKRQYPQLQLEGESLYGIDGTYLKDFDLQEDGSLISVSGDPWIDYELPETMDIKAVEIITESVSEESTWAQLHFILEDNTWVHEPFYLHSGQNRILTNDGNGLENVRKVRFDLVSKSDIRLKTEKVTINASRTLTLKYHMISICVMIGVILAMFLPDRIKRHHRAEYREMLPGIGLSFAMSFLICVFAPLDLYFNNQDEFWFDLYTLLPLVFWMFAIGVLAGGCLMGILFLLHKKIYRAGVAAGLCIFVITYIQGNYLVGHLPPLDGSEFDWMDYSAGRRESVLLWGMILLIAGFLAKKLSAKKFYHVTGWITGGITAMLILTLCMECFTTYGYQQKLNAHITTENQFEMSKDKNFIILVLDALDAGMFSEVLNANPDDQKTFTDFTYYPDTMGAYPYTSRSIPYILSGIWFENEQLFSRYHENAYKSTGIFEKLEEENYKLGVYESSIPLTDESIFRFDNVFERQNKIKSYAEFARLELKLAGFKYAPFDFKKYCVAYTEDFNLIRKEIRDEEKDRDYDSFSSGNRRFYDDIFDESITFTKQKCFKFIHIAGAHPPFCNDAQMNVIENGSCEQSIQASITLVNAYLNKLKSDGVYDNSAIVIMADHGRIGQHNDGRQNPLFMVKGIGERHKMQVSYAPISYEDLQLVYDRLLAGANGGQVSDWKQGDQRERRFLWYGYLGEDHMIEYLQKGKASDAETMVPTGREYVQRR